MDKGQAAMGHGRVDVWTWDLALDLGCVRPRPGLSFCTASKGMELLVE